MSLSRVDKRTLNSDQAFRDQNLINPSGSAPLYTSREIDVIEEEPEDE
jgi:hypothetical protein